MIKPIGGDMNNKSIGIFVITSSLLGLLVCFYFIYTGSVIGLNVYSLGYAIAIDYFVLLFFIGLSRMIFVDKGE